MEKEQRPGWVKNRCEWSQFLSNLDIFVITAGYAENFYKWTFPRDYTEEIFYRIYLEESGSFRLLSPKGCTIIEPGKFYLIPCNMFLKYEGIVPCNHYWIHFVSNHLRTIPALNEPIQLPLPNSDPIREKMKEIIDRMKNFTDLQSAVFVKNSVTELLVPFLQKIAERLPEKNTFAAFTNILNYIDTNLHRDFAISELNDLSGMRQAEFSAAFRKVFGLPPKQYISMRRINRAKYLLLETALPIKEIARRCGYQDEYFFHRIFKKYTGNPPARYRKYSIY